MSIQTQHGPTPSDSATRVEPAGRRVVLRAVAAGALVGLVLVMVVFAGGTESRITGSVLIGLAAMWGLLHRWSAGWATPQRWARVPAVAFGTTGLALVAAAPGAGTMDLLAWVWPLPVAALSLWSWSRMRRDLPRQGRRLLAPVLVALLAACVGAAYQDVALSSGDAAPGERFDVGGRALHLDCRGPEGPGPTVVLLNGLGGSSSSWTHVTDPVRATGTRVCTYDRAGQGWSDPAPAPQDAVAAARDLHAVLDRAGERPPYVLAGHSTGGTYALTYQHTYPEQVAGLVLLDSSSPEQATRKPGFTIQLAVARRLVSLAPTLTRVVPGLGTPAEARTLRDEQAVVLEVFRQAQSVRTLGRLPLAVVTSAENAQATDWAEAQEALADLSDNVRHRTAEGSHGDVIEDPATSQESVDAITRVVRAVHTGRRLQP
jgi:pimeloyl-ACP methyl ester carboxylesterase